MKWQIDVSREANKFVKKNNISDNTLALHIKQALNKLQGRDENIDLKKMKSKWRDSFRLRVGKIRIIFKIDFEKSSIFVDRIDFRRDVYK